MSQVEIVQKKNKVSKMSWANAKKFTKGSSKILWIQILQSFTSNKMIGILLTVIISALPVIIAVATKRDNELTRSNQVITQAIITAAVISFVNMSFSNLKDKATLDKNRIAYLMYGKKAIALGKVGGNSMQFLLQIVCAYLAVLIIAAAGGMDISGQNAGKIITYFLAFSCYFTMVQTGTRYISAAFSKAWLRIVMLGLWAALTLGIYIAVSTTVLLPSTGVLTFYMNNRAWISVVPFMNSVLSDVMISGLADFQTITVSGVTTVIPNLAVGEQIWPVVVMAIESLILCASVWKPFSGKLKTYLTT